MKDIKGNKVMYEGQKALATYTVLPPVAVKEKAAAAEALLKALETFNITDTETAATAGELLKETHAEHKALEDLRKQTKAPALEAGRDIDAFFKPATTAWLKAKSALTAKLTAYQREVEEANRRALMDAAKAATTARKVEALATIATAPPPAGVAYRDIVRVEVTDPAAVPREYMLVDVRKLQELAKAGGTAPAGVAFIRETKAQVGR